MDYKLFLKNIVKNNDMKSLKKYNDIIERLVKKDKKFNKYLLKNNMDIIKQYGGNGIYYYLYNELQFNPKKIDRYNIVDIRPKNFFLINFNNKMKNLERQIDDLFYRKYPWQFPIFKFIKSKFYEYNNTNKEIFKYKKDDYFEMKKYGTNTPLGIRNKNNVLLEELISLTEINNRHVLPVSTGGHLMLLISDFNNYSNKNKNYYTEEKKSTHYYSSMQKNNRVTNYYRGEKITPEIIIYFFDPNGSFSLTNDPKNTNLIKVMKENIIEIAKKKNKIIDFRIINQDADIQGRLKLCYLYCVRTAVVCYLNPQESVPNCINYVISQSIEKDTKHLEQSVLMILWINIFTLNLIKEQQRIEKHGGWMINFTEKIIKGLNDVISFLNNNCELFVYIPDYISKDSVIENDFINKTKIFFKKIQDLEDIYLSIEGTESKRNISTNILFLLNEYIKYVISLNPNHTPTSYNKSWHISEIPDELFFLKYRLIKIFTNYFDREIYNNIKLNTYQPSNKKLQDIFINNKIKNKNDAKLIKKILNKFKGEYKKNDKEITNDDLFQFSKLIKKYPKLTNLTNIQNINYYKNNLSEFNRELKINSPEIWKDLQKIREKREKREEREFLRKAQKSFNKLYQNERKKQTERESKTKISLTL